MGRHVRQFNADWFTDAFRPLAASHEKQQSSLKSARELDAWLREHHPRGETDTAKYALDVLKEITLKYQSMVARHLDNGSIQ